MLTLSEVKCSTCGAKLPHPEKASWRVRCQICSELNQLPVPPLIEPAPDVPAETFSITELPGALQIRWSSRGATWSVGEAIFGSFVSAGPVCFLGRYLWESRSLGTVAGLAITLGPPALYAVATIGAAIETSSTLTLTRTELEICRRPFAVLRRRTVAFDEIDHLAVRTVPHSHEDAPDTYSWAVDAHLKRGGRIVLADFGSEQHARFLAGRISRAIPTAQTR